MHMADAMVSPGVATAMGAASLAAGAYCVYKIKKESAEEKIPLMGVMSAFVFAGQMVNFSIPGTGSSGHICGGLLLAALIGPYGAFLSMAAILLIQCLIFADGGLMAYGCNLWNMAFYACFVGYFCIYKPILGKNPSKAKIMAGSLLGSVISLQLGALSVVAETLLSGITELPTFTFLALMQPIHLAIGAVEGVATGLILIYIYSVSPRLITDKKTEEKHSFGKVLAALAISAAMIGGGFSLLASEKPDGLEWSIENTVKTSEEGAALEGSRGIFGEITEKTVLFPDYSTSLTEDEAVGTSLSGFLGSILVGAVLVVFCAAFKLFK